MEARIDRGTVRMHGQTRRVGRSIIARANSDHVTINQFGWPSEVTPGSVHTLTTEISAAAGGALGTFVGDPDFCVPRAFANDGIRVEVRTFSAGTQLEQTTEYCIPDGGSRTHESRFTAPDSGDFSIRVEVRGKQSGNLLGEATGTITVQTEGDGEENPGGATQPPGADPDADPDGGGPWLPCIIDPNRSCNTGESLAIGGAAFAFLLLLVVTSR